MSEVTKEAKAIAVEGSDSNMAPLAEEQMLGIIERMSPEGRVQLGRLLGVKPTRTKTRKNMTNDMVKKNMLMVGEVSHAPGFKPAVPESIKVLGVDAVELAHRRWEEGLHLSGDGIEFDEDYADLVSKLDDDGTYAGATTPEQLGELARGNE